MKTGRQAGEDLRCHLGAAMRIWHRLHGSSGDSGIAKKVALATCLMEYKKMQLRF